MAEKVSGSFPESAEGEKALGVLFWRGAFPSSDKPLRIMCLIALSVCVISLTLTDLGVYQIGHSADGQMVFLLPLLAPVVAVAMLYGALAGAAVGLLAGVVSFAHAQFAPATFYEPYFITIISSVVLFTLVGFLFGIAFAVIDKRVVRPASRIAVIACLSLLVSALVSLSCIACVLSSAELADAFALDSSSLGSVIAQSAGLPILVDACLVFALCAALDRISSNVGKRGTVRGLSSVFQGWLLLVMLIVFMVMATCEFLVISAIAEDDARTSIESEIDYLSRQLNDHGAEPESVLDGYDEDIDGTVVVLLDDVVVCSDSDDYLVGTTVNELFGIESDDGEYADYGRQALDEVIGQGDFVKVETYDDDDNVQLCVMRAMRAGDYDILMTWPLSKVYANRPATMGWTTLISLAQLIAVFLLATLLLRHVVVQRIDETNESLGRITQGDLDERVNIRDSREFASLSLGINATVAALKDSITEAEQKNAQELLTAKAIQESSLPREFPPYPDIDAFDIYASMKTAKEVGGDFYDFFLIGDDKLGFIMADVSGKGIPAALFMMTAKTQIKNYMEAELPLGEAVNAANHQLCIGNDAGMFVTMFACVLEYETGLLTYVNGGHNPPLILHDGVWEWMREVSGMPLGLFDGIPYETFTRQLEIGDMLYLYTDGVTEAMNADGDLFGEDRLVKVLEANSAMNPRSLGVAVRRAITDFTLDADQSDDITMLALKYGVPPEKRAVMVLRATDDQLVHVCNFIHEELRRRSAPKSVYNPIDIAAEELFVNVCHYAYPDATPDDPGTVRIGFEYEANPPSLTIMIADDGVAYNPLAKPDAQTPDDIMDVPIGGLGILMAKSSVDDMAYRREGDSNILTFRKGW